MAGTKREGSAHDPSRKGLGGPYGPKIPGGGTNPFAHKAKTKATQKTKVAKKPTRKKRSA